MGQIIGLVGCGILALCVAVCWASAMAEAVKKRDWGGLVLGLAIVGAVLILVGTVVHTAESWPTPPHP